MSMRITTTTEMAMNTVRVVIVIATTDITAILDAFSNTYDQQQC